MDDDVHDGGAENVKPLMTRWSLADDNEGNDNCEDDDDYDDNDDNDDNYDSDDNDDNDDNDGCGVVLVMVKRLLPA